MRRLWATVETNHEVKPGGEVVMYGLLAAAALCIGFSFKYIGPPAWVLGALGIVFLVSSYLWEVYRK